MDAYIEFNQSAFKHGVTEKDIRSAFAHKVLDHPLDGEEEKNLLIGFDTKANVLEILYNRVVRKLQFLLSQRAHRAKFPETTSA